MDTTEDIPRFGYVSCAALTDVGRRRKNNEDNYGTFPDAGVFCVADGMGGARDGEVASRIVVEHLAGALKHWEKVSPPIPMEDRLALVDKCLDAASLWINQYAASHDATGCGTTFVGVVLDPGKPGHAVAVHAGDSRLYRIHRNKIAQITCDHSVANMTGVKNENELNPVFRNMILRAVGIKPTVELERTSFELVQGDWVLICSDGLTKMVDDKSIAKIVAASDGGKAAVDALVTEANRCGGRDNITVVLLHVGELPPALPVHARLTEPEFLACMGVAASEAPTTTETAFTIHTGASSTEPSALNAGSPDGVAANTEGWLSEDEDSDNTPVPVDDDGDDGNRDEVRSTKDEGQSTKGDGASGGPGVVPAAPADSSDADTKTTEDIPPPPDPSAGPGEARTTEEMPPPAAGRRLRKLVPVLVAAAVLAGALGLGIHLWKEAQLAAIEKARLAEEARLAAIEKARLAEEARLAAIAVAETNFTAKATAVLLPLHDLAAQIQHSEDPESFTNVIGEARRRLDAIWAKAEEAGVTNQARYAAKLDSYRTLSTKAMSAIANRRQALDAEAERLARIAAAEAAFANRAAAILAPLYGLTTQISGSNAPESFTNVTGKVKRELDAAWEKARGEGAVNQARYTEKKVEYTTLSDVVAKAISARRDRLDAEGECSAREGEYNRLAESAAGIAARAAYKKALGDMDEAVKGLPREAKYEDLRGRYEDLREKYGKLRKSISAQTAKIVVRNEGEAPLSVTLGGKTETVAEGKSLAFDNLEVWSDYDVRVAVRPPSGRAESDYSLDRGKASVGTKGPKDAAVPISFKAKYKGPSAPESNPMAAAADVKKDPEHAGRPSAAGKKAVSKKDFEEAKRKVKADEENLSKLKLGKRTVEDPDGKDATSFFVENIYPAVTNLMPCMRIIREHGADKDVEEDYAFFVKIVNALRDRVPQEVLDEVMERKERKEGKAEAEAFGKAFKASVKDWKDW